MNEKSMIIVTETLGVDGPERVISELSQEWSNKGYAITIIVTRAKNRIATYQFSKLINIEYLSAYDKGNIFSRIKEIYQLRKILKTNSAHVCISLMVSTSFSLSIATRGLNKRVILSERNDPSKVPFTRFQRMLRNMSFEFADAIVFQTLDAMKYFPKRIQNKGTIIFNPVNPNLPQRYNGDREREIIAVGRLAEQKNFMMLIKAFSLVAVKYDRFVLTIYGEGEKRKEIEEYVDRLGLVGRVRLPGFNNDVYNDMMRCAMYISSSNYEGMSNSMLEALAMGIPTICTDCPIGGARTIIENNRNGLLVPVNDSVAMSEAMERIINDAELAESLSQHAYEIRERLNISTIGNEWLKVMEG